MKRVNIPNEVDVVKTIHEALNPLEQDKRIRVLQAVMTLLQINSPVTPQLNAPPASGLTSVTTLPNNIDKIDKFVSSKKPTDTYQKLACLAYWLETKENVIDFSKKELEKANTDARQSKISNISRFLDLATSRHGFFTASGKGKKRISTRGSAVVEALPNQELVKEALKQLPLPKKGGRKPKSKKK